MMITTSTSSNRIAVVSTGTKRVHPVVATVLHDDSVDRFDKKDIAEAIVEGLERDGMRMRIILTIVFVVERIVGFGG